MNSFGNRFRITTWGESHGPAIGVVIDGCPAGVPISPKEIDDELSLRRPGQSPYTSPRTECDKVEVLSGVFEGVSSGQPISLLIKNQDSKPQHYDEMKDLFRPGHANYTYIAKYGVFDHRGGGRASARETASRVAAGAVARKILSDYNIDVLAFLTAAGRVQGNVDLSDLNALRRASRESPVFCPERNLSRRIEEEICRVTAEGDSVGGLVKLVLRGLPVGLGDPIYDKLDARLAWAMMSIPASKSFEIGEGRGVFSMQGSQHNDGFSHGVPSSNRAGGILGGISTGEDVLVSTAFKPTSSIKKTQSTSTVSGKNIEFKLSPEARHDPCVAVRAVPVVEAMGCIVAVDFLLSFLDEKHLRRQVKGIFDKVGTENVEL